jgi:hypothetical protein
LRFCDGFAHDLNTRTVGRRGGEAGGRLLKFSQDIKQPSPFCQKFDKKICLPPLRTNDFKNYLQYPVSEDTGGLVSGGGQLTLSVLTSDTSQFYLAISDIDIVWAKGLCYNGACRR